LPLNTLAPQLLTSLETRQLPKAKAIEWISYVSIAIVTNYVLPKLPYKIERRNIKIDEHPDICCIKPRNTTFKTVKLLYTWSLETWIFVLLHWNNLLVSSPPPPPPLQCWTYYSCFSCIVVM
jgi:hypothetical protein